MSASDKVRYIFLSLALLVGCASEPKAKPRPWVCICGHDEKRHAVGWGVCLDNDGCDHFDRDPDDERKGQ